MAGRFRFNSIGAKLIAIVAVAVMIAVISATGFFIVRQTIGEIDARRASLTATAKVFSAAVARHVAGGHKGETLNALRAIAGMRQIPFIAVNLADGSPFAELGSAVLVFSDLRPSAPRHGVVAKLAWIARGSVMPVTAPVRDNGRDIATLTLLGDVSDLRDRFFGNLLLALLAGLAASAVGLIAAVTLKGRITGPLGELAATMSTVRADHDYTVRVKRRSDDETGVLVDAFNDMLEQILNRDVELSRHRETLEATVAERTRQLADARDEAVAANQAKSSFLATMSHEIRTPMNGIMVMAELLNSSALPAKQKRFAEVIANSGNSLLSIINDILDLAKVEAGKLEIESVEVDVGAVVGDVVSLFWQRSCDKGIDLTSRISPAVPAVITSDPVRLNQVLSNLVNNALKFTDSGHVVVSVTMPASGGGIEFSVLDSGIGIPADKVATVFEAFSQADASTTRKFGGTGLGLNICQRLVEAMGGEIGLDSVHGKGSRFWFRLPASGVSAPPPWPRITAGEAAIVLDREMTAMALAAYLGDAGVKTHRLPASAGAVPATSRWLFAEPGQLARLRADQVVPDGCRVIALASLGEDIDESFLRAGFIADALFLPAARRDIGELVERMADDALRGSGLLDQVAAARAPQRRFPGLKVLVADDNPVNREVIAEALTRLEVDPTLVADGAEALATWRDGDFALVFMDCSMPVMDGFAAARAIREAERAACRQPTPIVALTAQVAGGAGDEWRRAGMDDLVTKPFTLAAIADCLARWCAGAEHQGEDVATDRAPPPVDEGHDDDLPVIDETVIAGLREMSPDGALANRVLALFEAHAGPAFARLEAFPTDAAGDEVAEAAHALKSMCANVGARAAAAACSRLEAAARDGEDIDLGHHLKAISRALEAARAEAARLCA